MTKTFVLAAIIAALFTVPASAQSLADAAKKAKEERTKGMGWPEPAARTAPVTPPADAAPTPGTDDKPASTTETEKSKPAKGATSADDSGPKTEKYWRARLLALTTQLDTHLAAVTPLETRYEELRVRYNNMNTVFQQQLVAPEMFRVQTELKAATDAVAGDQRAIDDLREEGRKAGALPGWLR